jgi:pSer/pThr/pTyr-binding forkhead associated (FHA) protein
VRLGRGHENDVRVSDISVSRYHAQLNLVWIYKILYKYKYKIKKTIKTKVDN